MNERTQFVERDTETFIDKKLKELGWIDDIHSDKRNVYKQQPATEEQRKKLRGKRADYILYQSETTNPLIVIEAKRPSEDIQQALEQGINYAKIIEAPLVIATNGEFTKTYHIDFKKTLTLNGEEVKDFFVEKEALRFIEQPHLITQENKVVLSRRELIKIFAEANDLLRKRGLQAGDERFSEFSNILFLKIISEIEESKENSTVEKRHLWNSWATEKGDNLKSRIDKALEHFQKKYQDTKKWIIENYSIQAIISLPKGIFLPYTGSKSSVIIIEKKKKTKDYFYQYQVKNDGFTLNNHRDRVEGVNDWDILISAWKEVVIEEKVNSPLFTKIYYKDVEENDYNLLTKPYDFPLPKDKEKDYLPLSEIARIFSSYRASSLKEDFINNGAYKVYQQEHVINNDFSLNDRYISEEKYQQLKGHELKANDVLMTIMGTLGKVAIFPKTAEKGIAYGSSVVIRIKDEWKEKILPEYLLAICQTPQMEKVLLNQTFGTAVQHLRMDVLKNFPIPIPSLEEQQKAIEELNNIRKMIKNSEENTQALKCSLSLSLLWERNQN